MEIPAVSTWFDRRQGVVVVEDDVQNVVRDIKAIDPRLIVYYNDQADEFDIVERCVDRTERLVFSVPSLDQRVLDRLRRADHWHGQSTPTHVLSDDEDFVAQVDKHNEEMERLRSEATADQIAAAGERIAYYMDAVKDRPSVGGHISVPRGVSDE